MSMFSWEQNVMVMDQEMVKILDSSVAKSSEVMKMHDDLKTFRNLIVDNANFHTKKCILCREALTIYVNTFQKFIESFKDPQVQQVVNMIKRTVLSITNVLTNVGVQIQRCFFSLKDLLCEVGTLNNFYLSDYCLIVFIQEMLNIFEDSRTYEAKDLTWGVANFMGLVLFNHYKAYALYKGLVTMKCIYTTPMFLNMPVNLPKEEWLRIIGKYNDEYNFNNYSRIEAFVRLHLSIFISTNDAREIWSYVSELFNSAYKRRTPIYFCLIYTWLSVCSCYAVYSFGLNYVNLLNILKFELMPLLEVELPKLCLDPRSLNIVNYYVKKIHMDYLQMDTFNPALPEGIIIPDERMLAMDMDYS